MDSYHGTGPDSIDDLLNGNIRVDCGGGEFGRGFYTGEHLWEAKRWASNKYSRSESVLKIDVPDDNIESLDLRLVDLGPANFLRSKIKKRKETRTYLLGVDLVWGPIVGTTKATGFQLKWESETSRRLLNGNEVSRDVV